MILRSEPAARGIHCVEDQAYHYNRQQQDNPRIGGHAKPAGLECFSQSRAYLCRGLSPRTIAPAQTLSCAVPLILQMSNERLGVLGLMVPLGQAVKYSSRSEGAATPKGDAARQLPGAQAIQSKTTKSCAMLRRRAAGVAN
jgi:hypothetical protein